MNKKLTISILALIIIILLVLFSRDFISKRDTGLGDLTSTEVPFELVDEVRGIYEGKVIVSGEYVYADHPGLHPDNGVTFNVNEDTVHKIPRSEEDERFSKFLFRDNDRVINLLKLDLESVDYENYCGVSGTATILITDYELSKNEMVSFGRAMLVDVIESDSLNQKKIKCREGGIE